ncbi:cysteine protease atg4 [Anaeramoeba flamelloides]|uniref:Cysteine protease n=1 Tax=Anaeramoeba flamelloides TaxID=1746091 RepID=A0ABQ8YEW2_9EUKA|nr:cysteine protease atg4 [Anaeramoeba flamelloides]
MINKVRNSVRHYVQIRGIESDDPIKMLGKKYNCKKQYSRPENKWEDFLQDLRSRIFLSYRNKFQSIHGYTSDTGWGCMYRTGQMMLAQAFQQYLLGRDWTLQKSTVEEMLIYFTIIRWFGDTSLSPYSIHKMASEGYELGIKPGEWHSPTTVSVVLRKLVSRNHDNYFQMYVAQDSCIRLASIEELEKKSTSRDIRKQLFSSILSDEFYYDLKISNKNKINLHKSKQISIYIDKKLFSEKVIKLQKKKKTKSYHLGYLTERLNEMKIEELRKKSYNKPGEFLSEEVSKLKEENTQLIKNDSINKKIKNLTPSFGLKKKKQINPQLLNEIKEFPLKELNHIATGEDDEKNNKNSPNKNNQKQILKNQKKINNYEKNNQKNNKKRRLHRKAKSISIMKRKKKVPKKVEIPNKIEVKELKVISKRIDNVLDLFDTFTSSNQNKDTLNIKKNSPKKRFKKHKSESFIEEHDLNIKIKKDQKKPKKKNQNSKMKNKKENRFENIEIESLINEEISSNSSTKIDETEDDFDDFDIIDDDEIEGYWKQQSKDTTSTLLEAEELKNAKKRVENITKNDVDINQEKEEESNHDVNENEGRKGVKGLNEEKEIKKENENENENSKNNNKSEKNGISINDKHKLIKLELEFTEEKTNFQNNTNDNKNDTDIDNDIDIDIDIDFLEIDKEFEEDLELIPEIEKKIRVKVNLTIEDDEDENKNWTPLIIFIPIRLGLKKFNEAYSEPLKEIFSFPYTLGVVGGKPNTSYYFVAVQNDHLYYLDPHITQNSLETHNRIVFDIKSYNQNFTYRMSIKKIDPSMMLGFLLKTRNEYKDFLQKSKVFLEKWKSKAIFSII